jgi:glycosyltransferase involved in cell wall biosynthesis
LGELRCGPRRSLASGGGQGVSPTRRLLRVSYDATAVPANPVGAGRYTIDLARALGALGEVDLDIWCRSDDGGRLIRAMDGPGRFLPQAPRSRAVRLAWEQAVLPRAVDGLGVDVHHGPHYTMPERCRTPVVVTVHDMTFIDHPEWHERSKVWLFRRALRVAAANAKVIVCVSATTADRLTELLSPRGRVLVVPHGVDPTRFHPSDPANESDKDEETVLERLGVRGRYVLFVGTLEPRKAIPDLVAGFDSMADRHRDLSLVIAGGRGWGAAAVDEAIAQARSRERIRTTGYVDDEEVAILMRRSAVVAYPALEEGFGLPALEALASGVPLVTTAGTSMAEVAGEAAVLVGAGDRGALAEAIEETVSGGPEVRSRVAAGLKIAGAHTWEASALGHLRAYRLAVEESARE